MPYSAPERDELTVGELAARSGVAVSALHFYERRGLISSRRNPANQRRYQPDTVRRVVLIRIAQQAGIPLAAVAEVLGDLPDCRPPTDRDWRRISRRWRGELDERLHRLRQLRDELPGCLDCAEPAD